MMEFFLYKQRLKFFVFLISVITFVLTPVIIFADNNAVISDIKIANTRDDLFTYFDINQAFTEKINEAVLNGISTTFSFYVYFYKSNLYRFDKRISAVEVKSTLKYNSLKKEFSVLRPWKDEKPVITNSFEEAKSLMTEIDNLKVVSLRHLVKGEKYQIRIKAELDKVILPLSLHYVFFFVSFWDFETDWYLIDFIY